MRCTRAVSVAALFSLCGCEAVPSEPASPEVPPPIVASQANEEALIVQHEILWKERTLRVCFRTPSITLAERDVIKNAFHEWEKVTALRFVGFHDCPFPVDDAEIGILQEEVFGPHGAGGNPYGAISLRISFAGMACSAPPRTRERCLHDLAVHELGHVLGFAHEQLRTTGGELATLTSCSMQTLPPDGHLPATFVGPWDLHSVMNYCNPNSQFVGDLATPSESDRHGASGVYGAPNSFADLNGDSRADAITTNSDSITARLSTGTSFGPPLTFSTTPFRGTFGVYFADVDADNDADAIAVGWTVNDLVVVRRSNGSSFGGEEVWGTAGTYARMGVFFGDVTGDGRADLVSVDENQVLVRRSNGAIFGSPEVWMSSIVFPPDSDFTFGDGSPWRHIPTARSIHLRNMTTGDTRADLVLLTQTGGRVFRSTGSSFEVAVSSFSFAPDFFGNRASAVADLDGNGVGEVIAVNQAGLGSATPGIQFRASNGISSFAVSAIAWPWEFFGSHGTYFANIDGFPGDEAIAVNDNQIQILRKSFPSEPPAPPLPPPGGIWARGEVWAGRHVASRDAFWGNLTGNGTAAVVGSAGSRFDTVLRGTDGQIYWSSVQGSSWSGWENLQGGTPKVPAVVRSPQNPDDLDVFVAGEDNQIHWKSRRGGTWGNYVPLTGLIIAAEAPSAVALPNGDLCVFAKSSVNSLFVRCQTNGTWNSWAGLTGEFYGPPTAVATPSGETWVFVRGTLADKIYFRMRPAGSSTFGVWTSLEGGTHSPIAAAVSTAGPAIAIRGTNGLVYVNEFNGSWSGWQPLFGSTAHAPAITRLPDGTLEVFATGTDSKVHRNRKVGGNWLGWQAMGATTLNGSPVASTVNWFDGAESVIVGTGIKVGGNAGGGIRYH